MNRTELKNQALLERISESTTSYENKVADLRVEVTVLSQEIAEKNKEIEELKRELLQVQEDDGSANDTD